MKLLLPLGWIYGIVMAIRNWMFDRGLLKQTVFDLPVISIGNLAVGGTGKTPHTEYLLSLLEQENQSCAMLSRGYGRKTHGFYEAKAHPPQEIGDEPWQVQQKFPNVRVCVCEKRVDGIQMILDNGKQPTAILLDDAFQHRYVKPGMSILLTDYSRPYYADHVMPAGRLREFRTGARRANIILVTKCPKTLSEKECIDIQNRLHPKPHQQVFFTNFSYGKIYPFYKKGNDRVNVLNTSRVLLLCGIANPQNLIDYLRPLCKDLETAEFPDHHNFTEKEIEKLATKAKEFDCILTTEKDAARLSGYSLPNSLLQRLWVQPIVVRFLNNTSNKFNKIITNYVTENSRNSKVD